MGATYPISFKITNSRNFVGEGDTSQFRPSYRVGQLVFVEDAKKLYLDFHGARTCYSSGEGSSGSGPVQTDANSLHYVGISTTNPTTGKVLLQGSSTAHVPSKNDVVVYGVKEYLYREGDDGSLGWYEIGDDNAAELVWEGDEDPSVEG